VWRAPSRNLPSFTLSVTWHASAEPASDRFPRLIGIPPCLYTVGALFSRFLLG
jgi:hypothetical protein